jgi:hypothetical protein
VRFSPPVFFRVSVCDCWVPICTLAKLKLVGLAVRLPAATAVPESGTLSVLESLLVRTKVPRALPGDWGAKTTVKTLLAPGDRVSGNVKSAILKPVPLTSAFVIVRLVPPVLLKVLDWLWVVPTCTFPKVTLAGAALSVPGSGFSVLCTLDLPVLTPWHPTIVARASATASAFQRVGRWLIGN